MSIFAKIKNLFTNKEKTQIFENIEDILLESDINNNIVIEIIEYIKKIKVKDEEEILLKLKDFLKNYINQQSLNLDSKRLNILLIIGVNGVGKTSSIIKLANKLKNEGKNVLIAAADTFRAAAIEQIKIQSDKIGIKVISQNQGSDASAVIFDSISSAKAKRYDILIIDTAGRLQNKENLIKELQKMDNVIKKQIVKIDINYKKILVIDSISGKNVNNQAEIFNKAIEIDGIIATKFDSSSRAGGIINISKLFKKPIYFFTFGEQVEHIKEFNVDDYLNKLL
ncbi:signal recognition particle-docking protein FtsY [Borrelia miyamotoi]|uniref:Signal recognition particle-docking protein FtsY n=1 Tax=Borrelia miyamotoi TaxID=47466 RepID=A0AAX3JN15_9SPIR|nr:signal recognition particle-docking protein FtsY [Borrelia miyamotoi]QFP42323.1 signal recognition particle-docking protein FtsY [Borrelia miyamotoi]QFP48441.1 signal recognition particle-docking protein FtsY [Borrelia miyamotoi]QGT56201.1 signal recognition particle-docking protein FtsY [Borrelia miyamotoi]QGT56983.1 signal recognition particle-docking protein FtsY [Borrelia miyamotoi]WAZ72138.1 signal recognition particle-docking protein FtsY [Borrelia miyamotoi]